MNEKQHREAVFRDLSRERDAQDAKWGTQDHVAYKWITIIGEEFGEASQAALNYTEGAHSMDRVEAYREELVQLAASAVAAIQSLDREEYYLGWSDNT